MAEARRDDDGRVWSVAAMLSVKWGLLMRTKGRVPLREDHVMTRPNCQYRRQTPITIE